MKTLVNLPKMRVCRTCMSRHELIPLFGKLSVVKFNSDQLFLATGMKIEPDDGLPQSACRQCVKKIAKILDFRELSAKVDEMLRKIMIKPSIVIKIEPEEADESANIEESQYISIVPTFNDGPPQSNSGFTICNIKKCHDDSCSNESMSLATYKEEIDRKPVIKKKEFNYDTDANDSKESAEIDNRKNYNDNQDSDVDNRDSDIDNRDSDIDNNSNNISITVAKSQGDTRPMLEINIVDRKPIIENETSDVKDDMSVSNRIIKKTNDFKGICANKAPEYVETRIANAGSLTSTTDKEPYNVQSERRYCNLQFEVSHLTEEEQASGRISKIKIEDVLSKEDMNEIFSDNATDKETKSILDTIKKCKDQHKSEIDNLNQRIDIPEVIPSQINNRYRNYINQMREKEMARIRRRKETAALTRARGGDKRTDVAIERDKKLMSLAVTPLPPNGPVQCKLCNKRVRSIINFKVHAKTHFEPEFACESCGKAFYNRSHMRYHQQRMHGSEKRLGCPQCTFRAVDRLTLQNHIRAEHTGERPYVCAECGVAFRMRNNLIQHLNTHFGIKNIQCELCPSLFTRRSQLWGHQMKVHYMTYTYSCYLCPETYKSLRPVKNHLSNVHAIPEDQQLKIKCVKTRKNGVSGTSLAAPEDRSL